MTKIRLLCGVAVTCFAVSSARADLEVTPDGVAVHDTVSGTYWLRDMTTFDHLSYTDQIAAIEAFGDGQWRMALLEDIESLDLNPDEAYFIVVHGLADDENAGRIQIEAGHPDRMTEDTHYLRSGDGGQTWEHAPDIEQVDVRFYLYGTVTMPGGSI